LSEDLTATAQAPDLQPAWRIDPPRIPDRWMERSHFSHDSHRVAACSYCHQDFSTHPPRAVGESFATSDVLMPSIATCRECHGEGATVSVLSPKSGAGVASRCVDCHDYHQRDAENMNGAAIGAVNEAAVTGE
jgi:hypothetical protein